MASASSPLISPNRDGNRLAYLIAMANMILNDGGGTRHLMLQSLLGHMAAAWDKPQAEILHLSHRTPSVSRKEGTLAEFVQEWDLTVNEAREGKYHLLEDQFHVMVKKFLSVFKSNDLFFGERCA